jgi:uncharacterized protein YggU (UPF0235/DUF167 family)
MRKINFKITNAEGGAAFTVQVIPNARQDRIVGREDDNVTIELTSRGGEESNGPLLGFLATVLDIDPDYLEIVAGHMKNEKVVIVLNYAPDQVEARLKVW